MRSPSSSTTADRLDRVTGWVLQPVALSLVAAALFAPRLEDEIWPIVLGVIAVSLIFLEFIETVWSFAQPHARGRRRSKGLQLILSCFLMVLAYAAIYRQLGVHDALDRVTLHDPWTALYFSVITTATVGYGDYVPSHDAKAFAAAQAMMSIVWSGLFFGVIVSSLWSSASEPAPDADQEPTPSGDSRSAEASNTSSRAEASAQD